MMITEPLMMPPADDMPGLHGGEIYKQIMALRAFMAADANLPRSFVS
jgi:hypothetical protein